MVCRSKRLVRWDLQVLINWAAWESWTISRMRGFVAATIQPGTLTTRSTVVRLAVPERLTTQQFCCVVRMGGPMLSVRWMTISIKVWLSECLMHSVKNRINFFFCRARAAWSVSDIFGRLHCWGPFFLNEVFPRCVMPACLRCACDNVWMPVCKY